MNKLLLSLGVVALLVSPAAAGRLDVDQSVLQTSAETVAPAGVDYSATRSIDAASPIVSGGHAGAQSSVFGANSR